MPILQQLAPIVMKRVQKLLGDMNDEKQRIEKEQELKRKIEELSKKNKQYEFAQQESNRKIDE